MILISAPLGFLKLIYFIILDYSRMTSFFTLTMFSISSYQAQGSWLSAWVSDPALERYEATMWTCGFFFFFARSLLREMNIWT